MERRAGCRRRPCFPDRFGSIGRASEWFQQEARARLQVLVEQTVVTAGTSFERKDQRSCAEVRHGSGWTIRRASRANSGATELGGRRSRRLRGSRLAEAAEVAASSFGQVLRGISEQEAEQFAATSRDALHARAQELEGIAQKVARDADAAAGVSLERFRAQLASHLETSLSEGRPHLRRNSSALDRYRTKRDAHQKDWAASLDQLTGEAAERYQERLEARATPGWSLLFADSTSTGRSDRFADAVG